MHRFVRRWKFRGQLELNRAAGRAASPRFGASYDQTEENKKEKKEKKRFGASYDPVYDLSLVRATYALRRALELGPDDFMTLMDLKMAYDVRLMNEAAVPLSDRLVSVYPKNALRRTVQAIARSERVKYDQKLGTAPRHDLEEPE